MESNQPTLWSSYGDLPESHNQLARAETVILPVPYDGTSTWQKGANLGPQALIEASTNMELYDIETDSEPYLTGIYTAPPINELSSVDNMVETVEQTVGKYLGLGKQVVTIGGEHSVSIGSVMAYRARFPEMCVLQLDAHADLRQTYEGSHFNHACVMARIREMCPVLQVGIRSMDSTEKARTSPDRLWLAETIHGATDWISQVVDQCNDLVYLTIDLDVFDPGIMPSTGTPEPGGLDWYTVLHLIKQLAIRRQVIGFDIVELCPNPQNKAPDFLAAKLLYKILAFQNRKNQSK